MLPHIKSAYKDIPIDLSESNNIYVDKGSSSSNIASPQFFQGKVKSVRKYTDNSLSNSINKKKLSLQSINSFRNTLSNFTLGIDNKNPYQEAIKHKTPAIKPKDHSHISNLCNINNIEELNLDDSNIITSCNTNNMTNNITSNNTSNLISKSQNNTYNKTSYKTIDINKNFNGICMNNKNKESINQQKSSNINITSAINNSRSISDNNVVVHHKSKSLLFNIENNDNYNSISNTTSLSNLKIELISTKNRNSTKTNTNTCNSINNIDINNENISHTKINNNNNTTSTNINASSNNKVESPIKNLKYTQSSIKSITLKANYNINTNTNTNTNNINSSYNNKTLSTINEAINTLKSINKEAITNNNKVNQPLSTLGEESGLINDDNNNYLNPVNTINYNSPIKHVKHIKHVSLGEIGDTSTCSNKINKIKLTPLKKNPFINSFKSNTHVNEYKTNNDFKENEGLTKVSASLLPKNSILKNKLSNSSNKTNNTNSTTFTNTILNSITNNAIISTNSIQSIQSDLVIKKYHYQESLCSNKSYEFISSFGYNTHNGTQRNYNEDRISIHLYIKRPCSFPESKKWPVVHFFSILDGHGGAKCVDFLKENLVSYILNEPTFPNDVDLSIKEAMDKLEFDFLNYFATNDNRNSILDLSGSCVLLCLTVDDEIYIANIGDSRAVLVKNKLRDTKAITTDHKPNSDDELKRILKHGGKIFK